MSENIISILNIFNVDPFINFSVREIMNEKSRLRYKRDKLRSLAQNFIVLPVVITMKDTRELHYLLHPTDKKRA